jgi:hypothetical protein|nr:MAG TPA: hypothetical protein [Caudoviricetes sp.]
MALIDISKIANGKRVLDITHNPNEGVRKRPIFTLHEFINKFYSIAIDKIDEFYGRVSYLVNADYEKGVDGVAYKMAYDTADKHFASTPIMVGYVTPEMIAERAETIMGEFKEYFNVDNCIRVKYSTEKEIKSLFNTTSYIEEDKASRFWKFYGSQIEDVFYGFVVGYIREFINEKITFTELDEKFFEADKRSKARQGHYSYLKFVLPSLPLSSTFEYPYEILTYYLPNDSNDGVYVDEYNTLIIEAGAPEVDRKKLWVDKILDGSIEQNLSELKFTNVTDRTQYGEKYLELLWDKLADRIAEAIKANGGDKDAFLNNASKDELLSVFEPDEEIEKILTEISTVPSRLIGDLSIDKLRKYASLIIGKEKHEVQFVPMYRCLPGFKDANGGAYVLHKTESMRPYYDSDIRRTMLDKLKNHMEYLACAGEMPDLFVLKSLYIIDRLPGNKFIDFLHHKPIAVVASSYTHDSDAGSKRISKPYFTRTNGIMSEASFGDWMSFYPLNEYQME